MTLSVFYKIDISIQLCDNGRLHIDLRLGVSRAFVSTLIIYSSMPRLSCISAIAMMVSLLSSSMTVARGLVPVPDSKSEMWFSGMGSTRIFFISKQSNYSKMKIIMEGIRPKPSTINDGRTWCTVRGLFPWTFLLVQKDSSKCPRKACEVVISFCIF